MPGQRRANAIVTANRYWLALALPFRLHVLLRLLRIFAAKKASRFANHGHCSVCFPPRRTAGFTSSATASMNCWVADLRGGAGFEDDGSIMEIHPR
jgi:hypothetical protein